MGTRTPQFNRRNINLVGVQRRFYTGRCGLLVPSAPCHDRLRVLRVRLRGEVVVLAPAAIKRRFQLVLIKPSHYDDDGYVVQWRRSLIPSNSLSCVYALARDAADRCVLGSDVEIDISACDETNTRVRADAIIDQIRQHDGFGMVGLVGVQSNQFPRAMDLARRFRAAGIPVVIGGFHVSGLLAMIPEMPPDLQEARRSRLHLVRGRSGRRADGRHPARGRHAHAQADLQLRQRPSRSRSGADAVPAARDHRARLRPLRQLRRRPRLPVPVLVLHHHQRAGPQVPPPHRRTTSSGWSNGTGSTASGISSSPTTTSRATRTGKRFSTG